MIARMNPIAALAWTAHSTIWRKMKKRRRDIDWAMLRRLYDWCEQVKRC